MADENPTNVSDDDIDDIADVSLTDPTAERADTPSESEDKPTVEGSDTPDKPEEEAAEAKDTEAKPEAPEEPKEQAEPEKGKPDPDKARQAYLERQQRRQAVARQVDQSYAPKTKEDFIEEGLDATEARIAAIEQRAQFAEDRARVVDLTASASTDAVLVQQDFEVFNPKSKEFDEDFASTVEKAYVQASHFQTDEHGNVLNAEVGLYDFYKQMADIYSKGANKNSEQATTEAIQMLSRTENPGGSPPTTGDSLSDLEEKLGDVIIT